METPVIEVPNGEKPDADALIFYPGSVKIENAVLGPQDYNVMNNIDNIRRNCNFIFLFLPVIVLLYFFYYNFSC